MRAAALGMVLLCLVSGCTKPPQDVTNSIGMELIEIPAGKFMMGKGGDAIAVTLTKPFWLGKTEVTQGQWQQVMGTERWKGMRFVQADKDCPATYVDWNDATAFCQKLTDTDHKSGKLPAGESYRLPTAAEWEYACRAGTTTEYSFGDDEKQLGQYAWFDGNTAGEQYAHAVGMKTPNPWGLYDMHGNVWEWCSDWYDEKLPGGTDPAGPGGGSLRVFRGGRGWGIPGLCRSASRIGSVPSNRNSDLGFRVARSQSETVAERRQQGSQAEPAPQVAAVERLVQLEVKSNSIGMELIEIPTGTFTMGNFFGDAVAVTLTKPFWLGKTEVTQGQFKKVIGTEPWANQSGVQIGEDNAASYVSWYEATAFCQRLTDTDHKNGKLPAGESYRLPTEAEWEYACRAGTQTTFSFGDDKKQLGEYAWFAGNANNIGQGYAHKVGMKKPNPWGLHDMHGNVWEWCSDRYGNELPGGTDPVGPGGGSDRVDRGGGWECPPDFCWSAPRSDSVPSDRNSFLGFRVARSQSETVAERPVQQISVVDPPADPDLKIRADNVVASLLSGPSDRTVDGKRLSTIYHYLATLVELDGTNQVIKTTEDIRQSNMLSGNMLRLNIKDKYTDLDKNINAVLRSCIGSDNVMLSPELRDQAVSAFKALSWACNEGSK